MSRQLGLIMGVNQYQDQAFRPLQFAENDARAFAQWLTNDKGGKWSPSNIQMLQGSQVTREQVESLIAQLCLTVAEPGDLVLLYFAGHAFIDEKSGEGFLALANTRYQEPFTGLHLSALAQQITARSRASQILIILDCFQSGQAWNMRRQTQYDFLPLFSPTFKSSLQQQPDRLLLCTCRGNAMAPEMGERNLGTFMYRTIVGLCGPASDASTGTITLQQLHTYLFGVLGEQQRPQIFGQAQKPFVLIGDTPSLFQTTGSTFPSIPSTPAANFLQSSESARTGSALPTAGKHLPTTDIQGPLPTTGANQMSQQGFQAAIAQLSPQPSPQQQTKTSLKQQTTDTMDQQRQQQIALIQDRIQQFLMVQNYIEALNLTEQILLIEPRDVPTLIRKGQILGTMGRVDEAMAIVSQLMKIDSQHPLVWSMQAVLLSNRGEYKAAREAIERSIELDASNPETHAIKTTILENMALAESRDQTSSLPFKKKEGGARSYLLGMLAHMLALLMGVGGLALPILQPRFPSFEAGLAMLIGMGIASLGLALLCVSATRGAYRFGFLRLLLTLITSGIIAGGLVGAYRFGETRIIAEINAYPSILIPILMLVGWLAAAATIPPLLAIGGFITGLVRGVRKR